jgi:hypothetical protein
MLSTTSFVILVILTAAVILLGILFVSECSIQEKRRRTKIEGLQNGTLEMFPQEFMTMRKNILVGRGRRNYASKYNFPGVYILHNVTKDKYYIGQGRQVLDRVNMHFTGHGNGDVYADYKYGDIFTIKIIALANSGFSTLNELEKEAITYYDAYRSGYNKTRGNRS